jgi:hypothetical protein
MLTAVWVAVVAFVIGVGVAVYVMLKAARLMSETSAAVAGLRERGDLVIERANAAIDQAGEQIARAETVTASMEGVTAAMAELGGQFDAIAPPAPIAEEATTRPLNWAAALVYGLRWALGRRRPGADTQRQPSGWPGPAGRGPGRAADAPHGRPGRPGREAGRRAALVSRSNGTPR